LGWGGGGELPACGEEDGGEDEVGGDGVAEEDPRWDDGVGWAGPEGLPEAGGGFGVGGIADPCGAVGDEVEGDGGEEGAGEDEGGFIGWGFESDGPGGDEGEEGGEEDSGAEVGGVFLEHRGERVGEEPDGEGDGEAATAADEPCAAEEECGEGLEVGEGFREGASEDAEGDEDCEEEGDREPALHGGRLQQSTDPGEGNFQGYAGGSVRCRGVFELVGFTI